MTNKGDFFRQTDAFIDEICQPFISVNEDWESIEVRRKGTDGEAYIRMTDVTGDRYYFDITAFGLQEIGKLVANVIANNKEEQIANYDMRKEIAKLFRN